MSERKIATISDDYIQFKAEITTRIRSAQYEALKAVNKEMIALYWEIGRRITEQQNRLGWGKSVVQNLSKDIQQEFPGIKGFSERNIWDMARFYTEYHADEILQPLVAEISWSKHIVILTKCKEQRERQFYILATKKYGWTKAVLIHHLESKTYERYLLGQHNFSETLPEKVRNQAVLALKDDYALKSSTMPIGVATYHLSSELPENYKSLLPSSEEVAQKLAHFLEK